MAEFKDEDGYIPPNKYLLYLDLLLIEDAAEWAETNAEGSRLLSRDEPTQENVNRLLSLLKERFPSKAIEIAPISFDAEIRDLHQLPNESLHAYYTRTLNIMGRYGAKDRSSGMTLSLAETSLLNMFLQAWVRGLTDPNIRLATVEYTGTADVSIKSLYSQAERTRRINIERQKLLEEERKTDELEVLKSLAESIVPKDQLQTMWTQYRASKSGQWDPAYR